MSQQTFSFLSQLVAQNSVSSTDPRHDHSNRAACEQLADWLGSAGFVCQLQDLPDGKCNLIARRGEGSGGLVLAGHIDTVPCDPDQWRSDPWKLQADDARWTGLGATDMKGFLALCADLALDLSPQSLASPLTIIATADEESGMAGAKALVAAGQGYGEFALIGEPTGLQPVYQHKGIFMEAVVIEGRAGHSSDPDAGLNAIEGGQRALQALLEFRDALRLRHQAPAFSVPYATVNPGCIHGGDSPNRIPSRVRLEWDLRYPPTLRGDELRAELRAAISTALQGTWPHQFFNLAATTPFETDLHSPIVQACEALSGQAPCAVNFATEGGYFNALGHQSIILGPGHIAQAHQPNEYLPTEHLPAMRRILDGLVQRFCLQ